MGEITLSRLKAVGAERLSRVSDCPDFEAAELIYKAFGITKDRLLLERSKIADPRKTAEFEGYIEQRTAGTPLQYILGFWEFYSLKFLVGEGVLIPRADTEILVEQAVNALSGKENPKILDLCCGSGCVGIAIAKNLKGAKLFSVDLFDRPLEFTAKNAKLNGLSDIQIMRGNVLEGAESFKPMGFDGGNLCAATEVCDRQKNDGKKTDKNIESIVEKAAESIAETTAESTAEESCQCKAPDDFGNFDLIVSNPPYIRSSVIDTLSKEVKNEPIEALDGGEDGLKFYRAICENFKDLLNENGQMMVEIGFDQKEEVVEIFRSRFKNVRCVTDLSGNDRVVTATDE